MARFTSRLVAKSACGPASPTDVTVGRGSWITPLTPILADVGAEEMWEGAPARFAGRCTALKRTAKRCRYGLPFWLMGTLGVLMQVFLDFWLLVAPTASVAWFAAILLPPVRPPVPVTTSRSHPCMRSSGT